MGLPTPVARAVSGGRPAGSGRDVKLIDVGDLVEIAGRPALVTHSDEGGTLTVRWIRRPWYRRLWERIRGLFR